MATSKTRKDLPTMLAHARSINPGHMLMFSAKSNSIGQVTPVVVRAEPLRGLNATFGNPEEKRREAVLQVVESAELAAGDDTLVLRGKLLVRNNIRQPFACNDNEYAPLQAAVVDNAVQSGALRQLAVRYAINLLSGSWGWRNALESEKVEVVVRWSVAGEDFEVSAIDLVLAADDRFNVESYAHATAAINTLADALTQALAGNSDTARGVLFRIEGRFIMGEGARVYPSQEWASESFKARTIREWSEDGKGKGITRVLAKIRNAQGEPQAIINDRKAGNALRVVDTWYGEGEQAPIAAEIYGANAHQGVAHRSSKNSYFDLLSKVVNQVELTPAETMYYLAVCVRGGVFGGKE